MEGLEGAAWGKRRDTSEVPEGGAENFNDSVEDLILPRVEEVENDSNLYLSLKVDK